MDPIDEAAEIFIRIFEALARRSGKTLSRRSRDDIRHACELLSTAGLGDLLDDLPAPPPAPPRPRTEYTTVSFDRGGVPPEVEAWRRAQQRETNENP